MTEILITKTYDQLSVAADAPAEALIGIQQPGGPMQAVRFGLLLGAVADASAAPVRTVAGRIGDVDLTKIDVGLGFVDNTADADKPISTDAQIALDAKVDHFPANPRPVMKSGLADVLAGWNRHFFDAQNNRIRPTDGSGNSNTGLPDTTDGSGKPSSWQMAIGFNTLYEQWKLAQLLGDAASMATLRQQMAGQWTYYQIQFAAADMKAGTAGIVNTNDDGAWWANFLAQVHEVVGDANALAFLVEYIPSHLARFHDPHQAQIDYGVATPGGVAFKSDPYGTLYFPAAQVANGTNYQSGLHELAIAHAALYVSRQATVSAALRAAFQSYAVNTWAWAFQYCRASAGVYGPVTVAPAGAIYFSALNLDPNIHAVDATQACLKGARFVGNVDAPVRGQTSYHDGYTMMMAALSYELYQAAGDAKYLAETIAIANAFTAANAFGRTVLGVPVVANARDPYITGWSFPKFVRAVFFADPAHPGTPPAGLDPTKALRISIYNTGLAIAASLVGGYTTADWNGPEFCPATGYWSWSDDGLAGGQGGDPNADYGGKGGGGQANGRQLMTASSAANMAQAAAMLEPYVQQLGSGLATAQAIEAVPAQLAAIWVALQQMMSKQGGYMAKLAFDQDFYLDRNDSPYINFGVNRLIQLYRSLDKFTVYMGGDRLTIEPSYVSSTGVSRWNTSHTLGFYAGYGAGPYINFDTGTYIQQNPQTARYEFTYSGKLLGYWDANGNLSVGGWVSPTSDNAYTLGVPSVRWAQAYVASGQVTTSDLDEKAVRGPLNATEIAAARDIAASGIIYQMKDAVATKGADGARLHAGYGAQTVFDIFTRHGLDPHRYGVCCFDAWDERPAEPEQAAIEPVPELRDRDGTVTRAAAAGRPYRPAVAAIAAGSRYALRYDELNAFVAAGLEQAIADVDKRLASLEAKAA